MAESRRRRSFDENARIRGTAAEYRSSEFRLSEVFFRFRFPQNKWELRQLTLARYV